MHKLIRDTDAPACLRQYLHGRNPWSEVTTDQRLCIWAKLDAMQGERCAYCEDAISPGNRHIEHFRQRGRYPQGTFDWPNLFGSCNRPGTCGNHKDSCGAYPHEDLIKPDVEDPELLLVFTPNGAVEPRANLAPADRQRALQTIRILGLDGALTQIRRSHTSGYLQTALDLAQIAQEWPEEEWLPFLQDELRATAMLPFATAIKHVLTPQSE
ncbi:TIGR02646 family protein [Pseudomonas sp. SWRI51]|uniref:retron Ec78 anti-phage system effector HNH endonuclease PtuB n=1 Tax=Pseudomonas sp. SWRI51 TaxID=2745491 RepID=UPI001648AC77|nr:retron Ec78 anti-phage system effector HNH endonuclease PtuB [Pseudomonas sp. SWRI51]MBC3414220.1 TIGR02646 family protein [Pseudomonas sp. SWRI51]